MQDALDLVTAQRRHGGTAGNNHLDLLIPWNSARVVYR